MTVLLLKCKASESFLQHHTISQIHADRELCFSSAGCKLMEFIINWWEVCVCVCVCVFAG